MATQKPKNTKDADSNLWASYSDNGNDRFWVEYEGLIAKGKITAGYAQPKAGGKMVVSSHPALVDIFNNFWEGSFEMENYTKIEKNSKGISPTVVFLLVIFVLFPTVYLYAGKFVAMLVSGIVTPVAVLLTKNTTKVSELVKSGEFAFEPDHLKYRKYEGQQPVDIIIPYRVINGLWQHPEGKMIVGEKLQRVWADTLGYDSYEVVIGTGTEDWEDVKDFLNEIASHNKMKKFDRIAATKTS